MFALCLALKSLPWSYKCSGVNEPGDVFPSLRCGRCRSPCSLLLSPLWDVCPPLDGPGVPADRIDAASSWSLLHEICRREEPGQNSDVRRKRDTASGGRKCAVSWTLRGVTMFHHHQNLNLKFVFLFACLFVHFYRKTTLRRWHG